MENGVSWQEALEAGLRGKRIKPYGQYLTYPTFRILDFALAYLEARPEYAHKLKAGEWFIEEEA